MPEGVERAEVAQFNKERQAEFAGNYKKAGEALRACAHCLSYEMTQCMGDPDFYTLRMRVGLGGGSHYRLAGISGRKK
jgi:hypothetical protein